ncbi:outer membrane protein assembly factor BamA [Varunaivibrio sulfuroxidans]|uniref:outer membrane protein assembly factor BamA n=1 Tax=Varunaivibrio sulfuroxidans TaxID=1773489 RepID=UPI001FB54979|nr:outer membrane protein assembly factor BamA [Varunaivibrio sulfuroxidans]WES31393.1 outer membrane protein assembly factor BamA [Varunaivibrio sulfuroxidans]
MREIRVEGARRVEPGTVRSYLLIHKGDAFDPERIDKSLKSLFATGLFADVTIRRDGDVLVVDVVENPVINEIAFEGNKRIKTADLKAEISLRPRVIYTRTKVQNDVERILTLYRRSGRFAATVEPKVIQLDQNRINLVYEIHEGDVTRVQNIRFVGNHAFTDSDLRDVIRTKETRWYRFLSSDDTYDPDRLTYDRELLRRFYLKNGYADFRVSSSVAELTPDHKAFFITYTVDEGPRYRVGNVKVAVKLRNLTSATLMRENTLKRGDWYNADAVDKSVEKMTAQVGNLGYAFVDIRPRINRDRKKHVIDITYQVDEGPRVFVERINISGNVRTLDRVIRREFRLVEGDAFDAAKLRRSKKRIQDLDFFKKVDVEQVPGSAPDKTVINVKVKEKSTGALSLTAGYSTTNGALVGASIRERNLLGTGRSLSLSTQIAQSQSTVNLSFTEPYFLGRDISAGFDIFHTASNRQSTSSFNSKSTGFALRAHYPLTDTLTQGWRYTLRSNQVDSVKDTASTFIKAQAGKRMLSEVTHTLGYDTRDDKRNPTEGVFAQLTTDLAGLGGDSKYFRNRIDGSTYYQYADGWVAHLRGATGYVMPLSGNVTILDRFFLGGDDLRGFASSGVGPRDRVSGDALGGQWFYSGSLETSFPIGLPKELGVAGHVFTDFGSIGKIVPSSSEVQNTGSLRASAGFGLSWSSPIGPIGVDFAWPVLHEKYDKSEVMRVNIGTRF